MRKLLLSATLLLMGLPLLAQGAPSWIEDSLYRGAKINAVVAVVAVIITGLAFWMFRLDRRISTMERERSKHP